MDLCARELRANGVGSYVVRIHTELVATFHGQRTESREVTMAWGHMARERGNQARPGYPFRRWRGLRDHIRILLLS